MILKANLAACLLFLLGLLGVVGFAGGWQWPSADDAVWLAAFASPLAIWSAGAWILRRHRKASLAWLTASVVLMVLGLLGIYTDVNAARQERLTGEETMHLAAFFAMLLQWTAALALLTVIGIVRLFTGGSPRAKPLPIDE